MSVEISRENIIIKTKNTMYAIRILDEKVPIHLYYGKKINESMLPTVAKCRSFSPYFEIEGEQYSYDNIKQEFSFYGYGDLRATALRVLDISSGSDVTNYLFKSASVFEGRKKIDGLPHAEGECETLEIVC